MKTYKSEIKELGQVTFPQFEGDKVYMHPFYKKEGLPVHLKHWQKTIDQMLKNVETDNVIFLMIDQAFVKAGAPHRRPGLHIDGYWNAAAGSHGGHQSNGRHGSGNHTSSLMTESNWGTAEFKDAETIILASNVSAAKAYKGSYQGVIQDMGNCENISTQEMTEIPLQANIAYAGNVNFLHESVPVKEDCFRTVVRLNVPGISL